MAACGVAEGSPFESIFICVVMVVGVGCVFGIGIEVGEE